MNGAEGLVQTAIDAGLELCFANPGTTELPVVRALDTRPGLRAVLGAHETVVTGAADGYGRMAGKPALTLLHLGPGFANGIANLHNARRAKTPVVNLIGEHAAWHREADAPLASDIESLATPVSAWVRRSDGAAALPALMAEAAAAAAGGAGAVATLILPHDHQVEPCPGPARALTPAARPAVGGDAVEGAAAALAAGGAVLFLGTAALTEAGLSAAARIAAASGADLVSQTSNARAERGGGLPAFRRLPYLPAKALEMLAPYRTMVIAGARSPVAFFGWPGMPSSLVPEGTAVVTLATPDDDIVGALEALAERLGAPAAEARPAPSRPAPPRGALDAEAVCRAIAALQPEGAIVVDEAVTSGWSYQDHSMAAPRFTQLSLTGGAIGWGPSCAVGAAVACPERRVINLEADGSGLYALQALWTQAREQLDVVTVVCANRRYKILQMELQNAGVNRPGPQTSGLTELAAPPVDWVSVAKGLGVPAVAVETGEDLTAELGRALATPGPELIEARIA